MNRRGHWIIAAFIVLAPALSVSAKPELFVEYDGQGGEGHMWSVSIAPDPAFFVNTSSGFGSSLAAELAFAVEGSEIVPSSIQVNQIDWDFETPGHNPFTGTITEGLWLNENQQLAFAAYGSRVFTSGEPVLLFAFETLGTDPTTVHYGVAASGHPTHGSIIAQAGQSFPAGFAPTDSALLANDFGGSLAGNPDPGFHVFSGYTGSVNSIPEPTAAALIMVAVLCGCQLRSRGRG